MPKPFLVLFSIFVLLASCGDNDGIQESINTNYQESSILVSDDSEELDMLQDPLPGPLEDQLQSQGHEPQVAHILFAHGYHDDHSAWDEFVYYIENEDDYDEWEVHRTDVDPDESIETRGEQLAEFIAGLDDVGENSLLAVGHSMGGLDLHYVVSMGHIYQDDPEDIFYQAAKKIHKIYTLASPHGGNQFGGIVEKDPGAISLGIEEMRAFNNDFPYSSFSVDSRVIPLLAFRFHCGDAKYSDNTGAIEPGGSTDSDGTVAVKRQILFGAPFTQSIFHGRHTTDSPNECRTDILETDFSDTILKGILDNKGYYTDVKDIVFYEHLNCEGDEKGTFSSTYKVGNLSCKDDDRCDNDEIASMMIYPGIAADTVIKLYDSSSRSLSDDWTRIHIGETGLSEPFCVNGFEHNTSSREKKKNITIVHHPKNGLNGKISAIKIFESSRESDPVDVVFYENKDCTGDIVGAFQSSENYDTNCKESGRCINDEASSVLIYPTRQKNRKIYLYNDPDGDTEHAWAVIDTGDEAFSKPYCVEGFEPDDDSGSSIITIKSHEQSGFGINKGLNGNVSRISIN